MLLDYIGCVTGSYQGDLREAFELVCDRLGYDLMVVVGRALESPWPGPAACNSVYELLGPRAVDALILASGGLATFAGPAGLLRLCRQYRGMPLCSLGARIPGVPSVTVANETAMEELIEHVLVDHGCREVAFIAGPDQNPDAVSRLASYRRVLARHGRRFDPSLVVSAHFTLNSGEVAVRSLLARGARPDAVIAANDGMALGAVEALRECGLRTPDDVLVTGFDDSPLGRFADPALTTVRQPLEAMAERAVVLVVRQLAGGAVPENSEVGAEFLPRASCGCHREAHAPLELTLPAGRSSIPPKTLAELEPVLFKRTAARLGSAGAPTFKALVAGLGRPGDALLAALKDCVARAPAGREIELFGVLFEDLQDAALLLDRVWNTSALTPAREFLKSAQLRAQLQRARDIEAHYHEVARVSEPLSSVLDRQSLREVLAAEIGSFGVKTVYVLLYPETGPRRLEPFLCWADGAELDASLGFDARELVPADVRIGPNRRQWVVLPLASENRNWGVVVLEPGTNPVDHERLPDLISSSLKNIALHHEIVEKTALHERSVQERQATAERLKALGVLAGGVAHDLNNALGPLLALPDVMQQELDGLGLDPTTTRPLRADLEAIRAATVRASRTIKDLVTLGRQGHVRRSPLDLNRLVKGCILGAESPFVRGGPCPRLELHAEPLVVEVSESHLARALLNLVHNAVDACGEASSVVVRTQRLTTTTTRSGYETIEPGDYAVLSVSDRGPGIRSEILARIFEPYFSGKPLSETSGSGLGLALVHGVVKEHDGFIDVKSTPGAGTSFHLYFRRTEAALCASARPLAPTRGSGRILIVDDDPLQIRGARRVLASLGYEPTTLRSGRAACALFEQARASPDGSEPCLFDLVITDMALGEPMDGVQVCERIRELFPQQRVMIASGHASIERGTAARERGIAWLSKPYTANEIGRAVADALESSPLFPDCSARSG